MVHASQQVSARLAEAGSCRIGERLGCDACGAVVVVLDVRDEDVRLDCCGQPITVAAPIGCGTQTAPPTRAQAGLRTGRLYHDPQTRLVLRCIRAGSGSITVDGRAVSPQVQLVS